LNRNRAQFAFLLLAGVAIVVFMVRSTLLSADKIKPIHSVYIKIIANHFQMLGAISNIDYNWPNEIEELHNS
jgi:hypothetical protein